MFGYITPTKSNLTKEDIGKYRAYYCGLCHELKEKYGKDGTFNLSYDMVFLSLLLTDLYNEKEEEGNEKCAVRPLKEHRYISGAYTRYAADMQMLLSYYSALDQLNDEKKGEKTVARLEKYLPDIRKRYPRQSECLKKGLEILSEKEKQGFDSAPEMALIFGDSIKEIFAPNEADFFSPTLRSLGANLGRFIYLMDAFKDKKQDEKKGLYNPLNDINDKSVVENMLLNAASDASASFEKLPLDDNLAILRNIIYSGIWRSYDKDDKK